MKKLIYIILILALAAPSIWATTYYVRTDGGVYGTTSTTCNGQTDAAYTTGSGPNCAVKHPYEVLGIAADNPKVQIISSGDTVIIKNGSYKMGYDATNYSTGSCSSLWPYDCTNKAIPSGSSPSSKTKIYGEEYASGCATKPELWGTGRNVVLTLGSASNVDVQCLEITDHESCFDRVGPVANQCVDIGTNPDTYAANVGIEGWNGSNNGFTNLHVHGLSAVGFLLGKQSNIAMTDVDINGNGFCGLLQDHSSHANDNSWSGDNVFNRVKFNRSGCLETYPFDETYTICIDQNDTGYGDAWGSPNGGTGGNFTFTDCEWKKNTSDALDMLYASVSGTTITVERNYFQGNVGQAFKGGASSVIFRNNQVISDHSLWVDEPKGPNFSFPRAGGNSLALTFMTHNKTMSLINNSFTGEADIFIDVATCASGDALYIHNNAFHGVAQYPPAGDNISWLYDDTDTCYPYITASHNIIYNVKQTSPCTDPISQTNCYDSNPLFTTINYSTHVFDLLPQSGSPARNVGISAGTTVGNTTVPDTDYNSFARGASVDIGALEYGSEPSGGGDPDPPATSWNFRGARIAGGKIR